MKNKTELNDAIKIVEKIFNPSTYFSYPYTEEYTNALKMVIDVAKQSSSIPKIKMDNKSDIEICGIVFCHGENDYGLWEGFNFTKEDEAAIYSILSKYDTQGCSIRGTGSEIAKELEESCEY